MKWTMGGAIALSALIMMSANDISAQQVDEARNRGSLRQGPGVEAIMRMRDRLELTEDQLTALEAIRGQSVQDRNAGMAEMAEMRSRLAAGEIQRSEMMAFMEQRREASTGVAEQRRGSIDGVLNDSQRESLQAARGQAVRRGQMRARRGAPGMRSRGNGGGVGPQMRDSRGGRPGMSGRGDWRSGRRSMRSRGFGRGGADILRGARNFRGGRGFRGERAFRRPGRGGPPGEAPGVPLRPSGGEES